MAIDLKSARNAVHGSATAFNRLNERSDPSFCLQFFSRTVHSVAESIFFTTVSFAKIKTSVSFLVPLS